MSSKTVNATHILSWDNDNDNNLFEKKKALTTFGQKQKKSISHRRITMTAPTTKNQNKLIINTCSHTFNHFIFVLVDIST